MGYGLRNRRKPSRSVLMTLLAPLLLWAAALYALAGVIVAVAFVTVGLAVVLPAGTEVTAAARLFFLPGAVALWPLVVRRWLRARGGR